MTLLETRRMELARNPELWQMQLQSCRSLAAHASACGLDGFDADSVQALWKVGLLRADLVTASAPITEPSLTLIDDVDEFTYIDNRKLSTRADGLGNSFIEGNESEESPRVFFHPFRLFVLYHVDRIFRLRSSATQYLLCLDGFKRIADWHIDALDSWTRTDSTADRFDYWNKLSELAIVLEPVAFREVFGFMRIPGSEVENAFAARLDDQQAKSRHLISELGKATIDEMREHLCFNAHSLDDNADLHVVLRFMHGRERLRLKGRLGACMTLLGMSEIIRRAAEPVLGPLREEDELRPGQWMPGARRMLYGTERVADANDLQRRQFMAHKGLDHAIKVRCYVEGDTEIGALEHALGGLCGVEIINLRGQVLERGGRGVAFVESLARDLQSHVFSVILLDQDRTDYVRAVCKAAQEEKFFGRFFLSTPDVEFGNFTKDELVEVVVRLIEDSHATSVQRIQIEQAVATSDSGKTFLSAINGLGVGHPGKGPAWGRALMRYAIEREATPPGHLRAGKRRLILEVADLAIQGTRSNFPFSLERFRIDPTTGELVARSQPNNGLPPA